MLWIVICDTFWVIFGSSELIPHRRLPRETRGVICRSKLNNSVPWVLERMTPQMRDMDAMWTYVTKSWCLRYLNLATLLHVVKTHSSVSETRRPGVVIFKHDYSLGYEPSTSLNELAS